MGESTATVQTLTAEVRVLMVGNRQVTLSVYRQLDRVDPGEVNPFGRVRDDKDKKSTSLIGERSYFETTTVFGYNGVHVVGRHVETGVLVRASAWSRRVRAGAPSCPHGTGRQEPWASEWTEPDPHRDQWSVLPLIVLAGLR